MAIFGRKTNKKTIVIRRPAAQDGGQPSLAILPKEVLAIIVELLVDSFVQGLPTLARVNTTFYSLARAGLQKRIVFNLDKPQYTSVVKHCAFLQTEDLCSAVQDITIVDQAISAQPRKQSEETIAMRLRDLEHICRLIPQLPALRWLRYEGNVISSSILEAIRNRPSIKLVGSIVNHGARSSTTGLMAATSSGAFTGNAQLYDLTVTVWYYQSEDCKENMILLKRLLLACKGVRKLHLNVTPAGIGCTAGSFGVGPLYAGMGFLPGEAWPPLEELVLEDYPFGAGPSSAVSQSFNTVGYPLPGLELDFWAENFDWSHLRKLHTPFAQLVCKLTSQLAALQDFACEPQGRSRARWGPEGNIADFLLTVPTNLHSISLSTLSSAELEGVVRHADTLRSLKTHMPETRHRAWSETAIDFSTLSEIRKSCLKLTDLTIDVHRDGTWPTDIFDLLSSYKSLQKLEMCFELGVRSPNAPVRPFVTHAAAETIFARLRESAYGRQSNLRQLTIRSNSSAMLQGGFPSPDVYWSLHNSSAIVCTLADNFKDANVGVCKTKQVNLVSPPEQKVIERKMAQFHASISSHPTTLSARVNGAVNGLCIGQKKAQRDSSSSGSFSKSKSKKDEAWVVAHEGPKPKDQWTAHY